MRYGYYWLAALLGTAAPALAGQVTLELRPEVLLQHAGVRLGDLALVQAEDARLRQAFAGAVLGAAPLAGQVELRTRAELEQALRGQALALGQDIVWRGAAAVKIRSASQVLDRGQLLDAARRQLQQELGADGVRLETHLASALPDMAAPAGALSYRARLVDGRRLRPRMAVWVDVLAEGAVYRSVVVPLAVSAYRSVYVARQPLAAGDRIGAGDFDEREEEVAHLPQAPLAHGALADGGRVREAMAAGQVASLQQVAPAGTLLRGDRVRLMTSAAGISVEVGAYAQADAAAGQLVRVRPENSKEWVMARVMAPGLVRLEEER
ncbi:flagellar basal body P-ring formation chaperone FlgA [Duganella radicis]|uniref:Flagellar basal body P-ring formation protein FlgA n=1 Tax=Duganella radicis TaxID=551988 RepID=A0A6L6PRP6_9BURK|nr:flagellar basal body P-ring formation chaperone FlgA [Duganella radicis]MTV41449.1 flagellar basal body P-ring formation protein FlgA [Duganella radicis]